jgi:hypothetical protein
MVDTGRREGHGAVDSTLQTTEHRDPREGSGVIPDDWTAVLQPKGLRAGEPGSVTGQVVSQLRNVPALAGVFRRDYSYDVFWVVFPLFTDNGQPLFPASITEAELVVQIYNKAGRVAWQIPGSIRARRRTPAP